MYDTKFCNLNATQLTGGRGTYPIDCFLVFASFMLFCTAKFRYLI